MGLYLIYGYCNWILVYSGICGRHSTKECILGNLTARWSNILIVYCIFLWHPYIWGLLWLFYCKVDYSENVWKDLKDISNTHMPLVFCTLCLFPLPSEDVIEISTLKLRVMRLHGCISIIVIVHLEQLIKSTINSRCQYLRPLSTIFFFSYCKTNISFPHITSTLRQDPVMQSHNICIL